jgi:hypothetical protein
MDSVGLNVDSLKFIPSKAKDNIAQNTNGQISKSDWIELISSFGQKMNKLNIQLITRAHKIFFLLRVIFRFSVNRPMMKGINIHDQVNV